MPPGATAQNRWYGKGKNRKKWSRGVGRAMGWGRRVETKARGKVTFTVVVTKKLQLLYASNLLYNFLKISAEFYRKCNNNDWEVDVVQNLVTGTVNALR